MTYPTPGAFPDVEQVLVDLLTPITYTCTALPEDPKKLAQLEPLIWARRTGGGIDRDQIADNAVVQLTIFARKRSVAQTLAGRARTAVLNAGGTKVNGVLVDTADEVTGVLEIPDIDPLNRTVTVAFRLSFRRVRKFVAA
ncbi:phage tail termination protein [Rhodococcus sp. NPDC003994]